VIDVDMDRVDFKLLGELISGDSRNSTH